MHVSCKVGGKVYTVRTTNFHVASGKSDTVVTDAIITCKQGVSARFFGQPYISFYAQTPYMLDVSCRKSNQPFNSSVGDDRVFLDSAIHLIRGSEAILLASLEYFGKPPFNETNPIVKDRLLPHVKAMLCFNIADLYIYWIDFFLPDARRTMFSLVFDKDGRFLGTASSPHPIDGLATFHYPFDPMLHAKLTLLGGVPLCS